MKHKVIAVAASAAAVVGLTACGANNPVAQPVPMDRNCADIRVPTASPLVPWTSACGLLAEVQPEGVDQARADAVVYDIRQKALSAERAVALLITSHADPARVREAIDRQNAQLTQDIADSRQALLGHAPEGFELEYVRSGGR